MTGSWEWLANDLANVPEDKLIVPETRISRSRPLPTTPPPSTRPDNLDALVEILGDRPALGLSGHTHTAEKHPTR